MKDYSETRKKVQKAILLMTEGSRSERQAAKEAGISDPISSGTLLLAVCRMAYQSGPIRSASRWKTVRRCGSELAYSGEERPIQWAIKNQQHQGQQIPGPLSDQRDSSGRFLPGNQIGASYSSSARKAKKLLADFAPYVAETLMNIFRDLPIDRPEIILAFAKEILDRGLGKPIQAIDLKETHTHEEYRFFEAAIIAADADAIRSAAALAERLESHARNARGASFLRQVEIIPPPGGTLHNLVPGGGREVSETHNLDASTDGQE